MKIIDFFINNWSDITLVFSVVSVVIYSLYTGKISYLKADLFSLVTEAEELYGGKSGKVKLMYVVKKIYGRMPLVLKMLLSEKHLEKIIEDVLEKAKKAWEEKPEIIGREDDVWQ